ncbi:hypothetical protein EYF80_044569 [Liparis tanakae]|uniref:Uncharacterized protein n=1 Tax=Liparis tanakae TaxID=230148 RepID=A0A4Z2FWI4_9TELE|nr:hypothetical protein EYF80_044569 [Liparis tanakae]
MLVVSGPSPCDLTAVRPIPHIISQESRKVHLYSVKGRDLTAVPSRVYAGAFNLKLVEYCCDASTLKQPGEVAAINTII